MIEQFEVDINYNVLDFVSAALVYRKKVSNTKSLIIIVWILVIFSFLSLLMPLLLLTLLCILVKICDTNMWQDFTRVGLLTLAISGILFFIANSNTLYRLRKEFIYRLMFF